MSGSGDSGFGRWSMVSASVDLWMHHLDRQSDLASDLRLLSDDERKRADRFVADRDRDRFICARAWMRRVLAGYARCGPAELVFDYGEFGKPALASRHGRAPFFSLSHTGDLASLAVSPDLPVGVDIEAARPIRENVAPWFFSPLENAMLDAMPAHQQRSGFYRCWTRKEALVKADGRGLSMPLDSFDVTLDRDDEARLLRLDGDPQAHARWRLLPFLPANGVAGAVAVLAQGAFVRLRRRHGDHCFDLARGSRRASEGVGAAV